MSRWEFHTLEVMNNNPLNIYSRTTTHRQWNHVLWSFQAKIKINKLWTQSLVMTASCQLIYVNGVFSLLSRLFGWRRPLPIVPTSTRCYNTQPFHVSYTNGYTSTCRTWKGGGAVFTQLILLWHMYISGHVKWNTTTIEKHRWVNWDGAIITELSLSQL